MRMNSLKVCYSEFAVTAFFRHTIYFTYFVYLKSVTIY